MSEQPQKQTLNLQTISQNFLVGLQRNFDMLSYNLTCRSQGSGAHYQERVQKARIFPFPKAHMNYEQVEAFSQDMLQRNFLNDMLQMTVACMDNCHLLCILISHKKELEKNQEETNQKVEQEQRTFASKPLHEKFEIYEQKFNFMSAHEDTLISLGLCLQCLVQKNGVVGEEELENGELLMELKKLVDNPSKELPAEQQMELYIKSFKLNDRIQFEEDEFYLILVTVTVFFHDLFRFIDSFAQEKTSE